MKPAVGALLVAALLAVPLAGAFSEGETVGRKEWTWTVIDDRGLALGGGGLDRDDIEDLHARGFRAIVNYRGEHPNDPQVLREVGMEELFLPNTYAEEDTMPIDHVRSAVAFIESNLAAGKPVYVHCTGGWHRSAVGVIAFFMKERGWRFEQAFEHVAKIRPGIEPRYADVLYEYERELIGGGKLTVDIWTDRWDVLPGEDAQVTAYVSLHGEPIPGANIEFAPDHSGSPSHAVSGPDGRANFSFLTQDGPLVQYVHATARKDGFIAGYDRNQFFVKEAKMRPPTVVEMDQARIAAAPGEEVTVRFTLAESDGSPTNARVTLTGACRTLARSYSGWDGKLDARFAAPEAPGEYALRAFVTRFTAQPVTADLALVVGEGGPAPPCEVEPVHDGARSAGGAMSADGATRGEAAIGGRNVPGLSAFGLLVAVALALVGARVRPEE